MKDYNLKIFNLCIMITIAISSCSKINDFGNINQNPSATTTPIPSALLTNTLSQLGNDTWDAWITNSTGLTTVCGFYCQYFSETLYTELSTYARPNINWDNYYTGRLYDLQIIINYNTDPATAVKAATYGSNNNQIAVARIMKVYLFSLLTDCYGDLPYSNALTGNNGINVFDKQEDIYKNFFKELSEAAAQFDNGNPPLGDILFKGDVHKWKQFANSLHALLALRLSKVDAELGKTEFNAALAAEGGVFESGENAELIYEGSGYYNPVYNYHLNPILRLGVSSTLTNWLTQKNDNRILAYASNATGFPYGISKSAVDSFNNVQPNWAKVLHGSATPSGTPFPLLTAAEVYLARAEAAFHKWTNENVEGMYAQGIKESWKYWGVYSDTDYIDYMLQPSIVVASTGTDDLQKICEQQWAAQYPNGPRGFSNWRRTGYPDLVPGPASISSFIPRRFPYGNNSYGTNPGNTNTAAERYTVNGEKDSQWGRIWWDE